MSLVGRLGLEAMPGRLLLVVAVRPRMPVASFRLLFDLGEGSRRRPGEPRLQRVPRVDQPQVNLCPSLAGALMQR